jgi:hypothetical protein
VTLAAMTSAAGSAGVADGTSVDGSVDDDADSVVVGVGAREFANNVPVMPLVAPGPTSV